MINMKRLGNISALFSFAMIVASAADSAATGIDLGARSPSTPYDRYMAPVKNVLGSLPLDSASMERVQTLMRVGRAFRYTFTDPYNPALPSVTAQTKAGDCKAKSLWLCDQLQDGGVRFVIGKARRSSRLSHAWVMWQHEGRWWILDCTNSSRPVAADRVSSNEYIPLYSYDRSSAYRHGATQPLVAVAGKKAAVAQSGTR